MSIALPARAKLNLDLRVVHRRDDGFHDLDTTMQLIDLHDVLVVDHASHTELTLSGLTVTHNDNSVLKAHRALEEATRSKLPVSFHLHKRIPPGSGMGGASSDAAAALQALKALHALDVDLAPIAVEVGSDVPFFLDGGRARVEGRGEKVTPQPRAPGAPPAWFAIAWPGIELSTSSVYAAWDRIGSSGTNDLFAAAQTIEPRLTEFARKLGPAWRMTGSGSAFFRPTLSRRKAEDAIAHLDCWTVVATEVATPPATTAATAGSTAARTPSR